MRLMTAGMKTTTTKTGTITVADIRKKFRIPAEAKIESFGIDGEREMADDETVVTVTHVVEAAK